MNASAVQAPNALQKASCVQRTAGALKPATAANNARWRAHVLTRKRLTRTLVRASAERSIYANIRILSGTPTHANVCTMLSAWRRKKDARTGTRTRASALPRAVFRNAKLDNFGIERVANASADKSVKV